MVGRAKRALPLGAVVLLALIAVWPEWTRNVQHRLATAGGVQTQTGTMAGASYHGTDQRGYPYTLTALRAREASPGRVELTSPKGDAQPGHGWVLLEAQHGVYEQHSGNLDLSGEVRLYREDGTTLVTGSANVDLKAGAAGGGERVHVEGPFGTLDAQNFAAADRGAIIQFGGPGRLVLNARR